MGKGLTLTHDEVVKLYEVLGDVLAVENGSQAPVKTDVPAPAEDYLAEMYYADQAEEAFTAQIINPWQRRLWCSNHIFFICIIKISKIHRNPPFVKFTGTLWRKKYVPFNEND